MSLFRRFLMAAATSYSIEDGVVYNKDKTKIISFSKDISISITVPDSVEVIEAGAFKDCSGLTEILFNKTSQLKKIKISAFENCSGLTSIAIPDSVEVIGSGAFKDCSGLTNIEISDNITGIDSSTFENCTNITTATISASVIEYINKNSLQTVVITSGETIPASSFENATALTSITLPDSVINIGDLAFSECTNLSNVELGNSVVNIGRKAFYDCTALKSITLPDSLINIGDHAFTMASLINITIPASVESIGLFAFFNLKYLKSITVSEDNIVYSSKDGILYNKEQTEFLEIPMLLEGSITLPNTMTTLPDGNRTGTFEDRRGITSITIPDSFTYIGNRSFKGCNSLTEITLPFVGASKSAKNGYDQVFGYIFGYYKSTTSTVSTYDYPWQYYTALESSDMVYYHYYIPSSLRSVIITGGENIYKTAFINCDKLTSIKIPDSITSIGEYSFNFCDSLEYNIYSNAKYLGNDDNPYLILMKATDTSITSCEIKENTRFIYHAFDGCSKLASIHYNGTMEKWNTNIQKIINWDNNTGEYTVYCSDGNIVKSSS